MPIFFPDNDKRKTRIIELASDTENYLYDATTHYEEFKKLCEEVNKQIGDLYKEAGLKPPGVKKVDVLKLVDTVSSVQTEFTIVEIAEIIVDIAGFIGTVKYLAPAATKLLVRAGVMTAETAAKTLAKFTIPFIGREVTITAGELAGNLLGGVVGGAAVAGVDLGIDAIEGAIAKNKLREGIHKLHPMRISTKLALQQTNALLDSIHAVKTTLNAITGAGLPLNDEVIKNLIVRDVKPGLAKAEAINASTIKEELIRIDRERESWMNEDEQ